MPIAASGTSAEYRFPTGKPTWVLVRSSKKADGKSMDHIFNEIRTEFSGRINFRILNWEDKSSISIIQEHSLDAPPASVLADSKGHVVQKFEGVKSSRDMKKLLEALLLEGRKR